MAINNLEEQSDMFRQILVAIEVQTDAAHADMEEAKLTAMKSETTANRSLEVEQACRAEVKAL
jgi:hypothetical protein